MNSFLFLLLIIHLTLGSHDFLQEIPVKLLDIRSVASRYPASNSSHRIKVENGHDEEAKRSPNDELNHFPELKLILEPGGCAYYEFPVNPEETNSFIQPARKLRPGEYYEDYKDKAPLIIEANSMSDTSKKTTFECFYPDPSIDPGSSEACHSDISSILTADINTVEYIEVKLCSDPTTTFTGAVWEINFSRSNDSSKLEAYFPEEARQRFRELPSIPEFDTQLSFVSIVGGRGVGKSTVASLLSGNSSMFTVGSGSIGTTTTGADVSTAFPSKDWSKILSSELGKAITEPTANFPLFLIDSEGMGVRGDAFDFMTTSPPAIIAKNIIWIGSENVQTAKIIEEIAAYLNGLDNIVMGTGGSKNDVFCETPVYGTLIIVINKMMGTATDEELLQALMTPEPDYIDGYEERNLIRDKMNQCFNGIEAHGLPVLTIPPGEDVDYPYLNQRFQNGLASIANTMVKKLPTPKVVTVAGNSMILNATNAEFVIATIIEEANKGKIDLNGFSSFWTFTKQQIYATLRSVETELKPSELACEIVAELAAEKKKKRNFKCSACVCEYRNSLLDDTVEQVQGALEFAKAQCMNLYGTDLSPYITEFMDTEILPWSQENGCESVKTKKSISTIIFNSLSSDDTLCDLSAIELNTPNEKIELTCGMLFTCGTILVDATDFRIFSENIYIAHGSTIKNAELAVAPDGQDAVNFGEDGQKGSNGYPAFNMTIEANSLIRGSDNSFTFTSKGGQGGKGGDGKEGASHMQSDDLPSFPTDAISVFNHPNAIKDRADEHHRTTEGCCWNFGCHDCHDNDYYYYRRVDFIDSSSAYCGDKGGNGGQGGDGGPAGNVSVLGAATGLLVVNMDQRESLGGPGGKGGNGAAGIYLNRTYKARKHTYDHEDCNHLFHCSGDGSGTNYDSFQRITNDDPCPPPEENNNGENGVNGQNWKPSP